MKQWFLQLPHPARLVMALTCSVLAVVLWLVLGSVLGWWWDNVTSVGDSAPRIARMAGFVAVESRLEEAVGSLEAEVRRQGYASSLDASQAGAQMQQELRRLAEDAGMTVKGSRLSQVLASEENEQLYDELTVELNMEGMPVAVDSFLGSVYAAEPMLVVETVTLTKPRTPVRDRRRRNTPATADIGTLSMSARITAARMLDP